MTRNDFSVDGDNYTFQPHMFKAYLQDANGGPITPFSLAKSRVRRDREHKAAGGAPLNFRLWVTKWAETTAARHAFGPEISVKDITTFYTEERFPDGYLESAPKSTFHDLVIFIFGIFFRSLYVKLFVSFKKEQ